MCRSAAVGLALVVLAMTAAHGQTSGGAVDPYQFAYPTTVIFKGQEPFKYGREPILRRMPDGSLACLIYSGGPSEPHDDNVTLITRSADDGTTWTPPEVLFSHKTRGVWSTELFTGGPDPCIFVHTFDAASHYAELRAYRSFTRDNGKTWSEPVSVPGGVNGVSVRQGIVLSDGTWVFPCYWQEVLGQWDWEKKGKEYGGHHGSWRFVSGVLRSADQGKSFTLHGNLRAGTNLWEPAVVEIAPNRIVMLLRADGAGAFYRAESNDGGRTWSAPELSDIPDPGAKMCLVRAGDAVVLLHNPNPNAGWQNRNVLSLWVSRDGCKTWPTKLDLGRVRSEGRVLCYPHAFADTEQRLLYIACDGVFEHYLLKVPFDDFL
ncbi:MAG: exo-alpha-sialidase [bacterium]|nr:exo-alpha-sialidase [bacterium]